MSPPKKGIHNNKARRLTNPAGFAVKKRCDRKKHMLSYLYSSNDSIACKVF